jgi:hypothetical protein
MPEEIVLNYPDVLGAITGGTRLNNSVVQLALAVRPRVVRAGRPFEVILLVQNASDADIDMTATLQLPEQDAARQKGRFVTKAARLVVGLKPAEVGYVVLPVSCLPDTAPSAEYKVGLDVKVAPAKTGTRPLGKPKQVRDPKGGAPFEDKNLSEETRKHIEELKGLQFQVNKRLTGAIETTFSVMSGKLGAITDLKPGWVSLWTLKDHHDDRLLLHRFASDLKDKVLPKLKRVRVYEPLLAAVKDRFEKGGYPLHDAEASVVARTLTLLLEYAAPSDIAAEGNHGGIEAGMYSIAPLLTPQRLAEPRPIVLPHWTTAYLRFVSDQPRGLEHPVELITRRLMDDLLRDAITYTFGLVEQQTGEELGDESEIQIYGEQVIERFNAGTLDFTHAFMPLVLGSILIFDSVIMKEERLDQLAAAIGEIADERRGERSDETEAVFELLDKVIDLALSRYGRGSVGQWSDG